MKFGARMPDPVYQNGTQHQHNHLKRKLDSTAEDQDDQTK